MSEEKKICAECGYLLPNERDGSKYKCDYYYTPTYVYGSDSACSHFYEDRYRPQREVDSLSSDNTGCFFTSASMKAMKDAFDDKCYELETIRKIRDRFKDKYAKEIRFYYDNAPQVVKAINALPDSNDIWKHLFNELVMKTVHLIESENYDEAYAHYKTVSTDLFKKYYPECLRRHLND